MKFEWEELSKDAHFIDGNHRIYQARAKVIGGWIVKENWWTKTDDVQGEAMATSMVFVPDPSYQWSIKK